MKLDELKEHCLKTLKQTEKFPTKTFEEHALVLRLIENQTSVIVELENIKEEINEQIDFNESCCERTDLYEAIGIINRRIAELKGENKNEKEI